MWSKDSTGRHHITRCSCAFDMHSFHIHVDAYTGYKSEFLLHSYMLVDGSFFEL
jgi:hypothetical protein